MADMTGISDGRIADAEDVFAAGTHGPNERKGACDGRK